MAVRTPEKPSIPTAAGKLSDKPLAHLLVYALERKLSGTFELESPPEERVRIVVEEGLVARVWTSEPVVYLGHVLYERGVIDGAELSASLAQVAATRRLHGEVLLARRALTAADIADGLRRQRLRKLQHGFGLSPESTFSFYEGVDLVGKRPYDVAPVGPLPAIWRGIRAHPQWEHVRATLATVGSRALQVVGSLEHVGLDDGELAVAEELRRSPSTIPELLDLATLSRPSAELLPYFLVISKLAEVAAPARRTGTTAPPPAASPTPVPPSFTGAARVRVAVPDTPPGSMRPTAFPSGSTLRAPRVPAELTGTIAAPLPPTADGPASSRRRPSTAPTSPSQPPPSSASSAPPPKPSPEAEDSLSQAEMHFVLGEREQAIGFVRKALTESPGMPAAIVFLAYLEALGARPGQESYLRDLLKIADGAIARSERCRRGYFYRAELKKRLGDHDGALEDLRVAVASDPDDTDAVRELRGYDRRVRDGAPSTRPGAPLSETPRPMGLLERLRGR